MNQYCIANSAKICDGLCNNCIKNYSPDPFYHDKPIPRTISYDHDYEELILIRQENSEF